MEAELSPPERRRHRSISQLKAFTKCGELFRLERIFRKEMPRRPAAWTILGVALHDSVMEWEKSERKIDICEYFQVEYDRIVEEEWLAQEDSRYWILPPRTKTVEASIRNYRTRGLEQLSVYIQRCEDSPWEISHIEKEFEVDLDGILVKGAIDRVLFFPSDESYLMEDLKSGSPKTEDDTRQLGFYAFVAREVFEVPVNEGRYWFTKLDRPSETVNLEKFDRKFWEGEFRKLDTSINEGLFLAAPGEQCGLCSVRPWCSTQGWLEVGEPL